MKEVRAFPNLHIRGAVAICIEEVWEAMKEVRTFPAGGRKPRGLLFSYQHRCGMPPWPCVFAAVKPPAVERLTMPATRALCLERSLALPVLALVLQVIKPQVVEKLAMLLMVVSQEEHDRRLGLAPPSDGSEQQQQQQQPVQQPPGNQQQQLPGHNGVQAAALKQEPEEVTAMDVDVAAAGTSSDQQQQQPATNGTGGSGDGSAAAAGAGDGTEWEAQERLVLSEFRDTLQVSRGCCVVCQLAGFEGAVVQAQVAPRDAKRVAAGLGPAMIIVPATLQPGLRS